MRAKLLSRRLHKWLAIVVGLQLLIWSGSGFYMVAVHIDIIHGDMLVRPQASTVAGHLDAVQPILQLLARYPDTTAVTLSSRGGQPVYQLTRPGGRLVADAVTGEPLAPLTGAEAAAIAAARFTGDAPVTATTLIRDNPPTEIQFAPLPLWRVDFGDVWGSSFYIDPASGRLVTRRHTLWRVFDFLWMLHIMDYDTRDDVNNVVLRLFSILALLLAVTGCWLLYLRFLSRRARA
jgi:hypothetical protein